MYTAEHPNQVASFYGMDASAVEKEGNAGVCVCVSLFIVVLV